METVFLTLIVFALVAAGLSVGVLFGRAPVKGSCGGLGKLFGKSGCELCENRDDCIEEKANQESEQSLLG